MEDNSLNKKPSTSVSEDNEDDDNRKVAMIIPMSLTAISGFVCGLILRGEFVNAAVLWLAALLCGYAGWWARGLR